MAAVFTVGRGDVNKFTRVSVLHQWVAPDGNNYITDDSRCSSLC